MSKRTAMGPEDKVLIRMTPEPVAWTLHLCGAVEGV